MIVFWPATSTSGAQTQINGFSDGFASTRWKDVQLTTHPTNYDKRCILTFTFTFKMYFHFHFHSNKWFLRWFRLYQVKICTTDHSPNWLRQKMYFHFWLPPTKMIFTFGLSLPGVGLLNIVEYTLILFSISSQVWSRHGWVKMKIMKLDSKNMENSWADFFQGKKCCTLKNWIKNRNLLKLDKILWCV